jgi:hypothetical protein
MVVIANIYGYRIFYTIGDVSPLLRTRTHAKLSVYSISRVMLQSKHDIAPLFVSRMFWQYVKGGGKFECGTVGNLCLDTCMGTKGRWHYIEGACILFKCFYINRNYKVNKLVEIYELCCCCECWFLQ